MRAGGMRRKIIIQLLDDSASDNQGGFAGEQQGYSGWNRAAEVWAKIEPLQGMEHLTAEAQAAQGTVRVTIRYRPGVKPANRLLYGKRIFQIRSVSDPEERHRELVIMCDEQQVGLGAV